MLPKENTSNLVSYFGAFCNASGAMNANVPFMEVLRVSADGLMARLMPKLLTLVTKETTFNNTLFGLKS